MKILFITHTRIGDAILSSGVLQALIEQYPAARFTIVCGPLAASLFAGVPRVDRIIAMTKRRFDAHWVALWNDVRKTSWDMVVDLRRSLLAYLIPARDRRVLGRADDSIHRVRYLSSVLDLAQPAAPHLYSSAIARARAVEHIPDGAPVLAVAPIAAQPHKTWPAEHFVALIQQLLAGRCQGWRVAVFGAPADLRAAAGLIASLPPSQRLEIFDEPDLLAVHASLQRCHAFVGNDSGLSHMAAAAGIPTLALFGESDPIRYAPWGDHCAFVRAAAPSRHITDLSVDTVAAAFNNLPLSR